MYLSQGVRLRRGNLNPGGLLLAPTSKGETTIILEPRRNCSETSAGTSLQLANGTEGKIVAISVPTNDRDPM